MRSFWTSILLLYTLLAHGQGERTLLHTDRSFYVTGERVWFAVHAEMDSAGPSTFSRTAYVELLHRSGRPVVQTVVPLLDGTGQGSLLLPAELVSDMYVMRAYTAFMRSNGDEGIESRVLSVLQESSRTADSAAALPSSSEGGPTPLPQAAGPVSITSDRTSYGIRQPVTLSAQGPPGSSLSLSVYRMDRMEEALLATKPLSFFSSAHTSGALAIAEWEGPLVQARLTDARTGQPVGGAFAYLTVPGTRNHLSTGISDPQGRLLTPLPPGAPLHNLLWLPADSHLRVTPLSPFALQPPDYDQLPPMKPLLQMRERLLAATVQARYLRAEEAQEGVPADTLPFYGQPDRTYRLDDYTRFRTMEEVIREYLTEVRVRRRGGRYHFTVLNTPYREFFDDAPLLLLDGIPVRSADALMALDPLKVRTIEVVARRFFLGPQTIQGIVSFVTYAGDGGGLPLGPAALSAGFGQPQDHRAFRAPQYDNEGARGSRRPDFRTLLHWSPRVALDSAGRAAVQLYTSDVPGTYVVVTQYGIAGSFFVQ